MFVPPVYVADDADVRESVVGPYVTIESGCRVERSVLADCILDQDVTVKNQVLERALLGQRTSRDRQPALGEPRRRLDAQPARLDRPAHPLTPRRASASAYVRALALGAVPTGADGGTLPAGVSSGGEAAGDTTGSAGVGAGVARDSSLSACATLLVPRVRRSSIIAW